MFNIIKKNPIIFLAAIIFVAAAVLAFFSAKFVLAFVFALGLLALSSQRMEIGLYFLMVYIPLEPFLLKFIDEDLILYFKYGNEALIFLLLIITLIKYFKKHGFKYIKTPIDLLLAIFILITIVSAVANLENPVFWILGLRQIFRYVLLYYIIIYSELSRKTSQRLAVLLMILLAAQAAIGLGQAIIGPGADNFLMPDKKANIEGFSSSEYDYYQFWESGQRVFSTMGRYDILGIFLCLAMLMAVGLIFEIKRFSSRFLLFIIFLFSLVTLALTYSRMSWLALVLGVFFMGVIIKRNKKIIFFLLIGLILLTAYLGAYVSTNNIDISRLNDQADMTLASRFLMLFSLSDLKNSYKYQGRLYFIVKTPAVVVKNYPLLGVGLGQYGSGVAFALHNTSKYDELGLPFGIEDREGQIDNNWFSLWGETGTLGLIALAVMIYGLFRYGLKIYNNSQDKFIKGVGLGFGAVVLAFSWLTLLGPYFESRIPSFYFWLLAGLTVNLGIKEKIKIKKYEIK
ncbi:hypothetical protein COV49_00265 [Candidatus Falkowbacteria bacterium CG11_big_fil_rev_8_21_14_0_20_39_10]|uniref:O-antigen ligase-related domain-containing protein n=1 Tax=Candidatus Falkowbacteria bacterium CG11_big_fil_rev_8_21_14_0_20_39_10 TaxID=1974570 RepID=A0A2M6KAC8_9BACT|nr:MAG: hypothetical protein COV49_00265 [Candidatus Falkowbacteria bacterium CG11_big_fil_rev_8_21_14_0_20_39_10]